MSEIKTRVDLFEAAAKMMRMCDEAGVPNAYKIKGMLYTAEPKLNLAPDVYEFPLVILEGRPVFVGDEIYHSKRGKLTICSVSGGSLQWMIGNELWGDPMKYWSWNPPKPKTVMVEYTIDEAKRVVTALEQYKVPVAAETALVATRKALENSK